MPGADEETGPQRPRLAADIDCYICNNNQQVCEYQQVLTSSELIEETKVYNERKCDDKDGDDKKKQDVSTGVRRLPHTD